MVAVSGAVTVDGQKVPGPGRLYFAPKDNDSAAGRPGRAVFDEQGIYRAGSFESGDGLVPGRYAVAVECWEVPPTMEGPPAKSFIAERFGSASTSGLEVNVPSGVKSHVFDITLSK